MAKAAASSAPAKKAPTKSDIINTLVEKTKLAKKDVSAVLDELTALISGSLGKKGPGVFSLPGIAKFKLSKKPATPARKGINPFTKEEITIKAKPARNVVKISALKALKDSV